MFMVVRSFISCDIHLYCCYFFFLCECDHHYSLNVGSIVCYSIRGILHVPVTLPLCSSSKTTPKYCNNALLLVHNFNLVTKLLPSANNVNFNHARSLIILLLIGDGHKVFWSCHVAIIINVVSKYLRVASSSMMEKNDMIPEL